MKDKDNVIVLLFAFPRNPPAFQAFLHKQMLINKTYVPQSCFYTDT